MPGMYIGDSVALGLDEIIGEEEDDDYELEGDEYDDDEFGDDDDDEILEGDEDVDEEMLAAMGLDEIIGGRRRRRRRRRPRVRVRRRRRPRRIRVRRRRPVRLARQAALARAAGGVLVKQKSPQNSRIQVLPIGPKVYTAALTADVEMRPQRTMRIERVTFSSLSSPFFNINSLNVGQDPQFVASGSVPAEIFSQVGVGVRLRGSTANLGTTVVIGATNTDAANSRTLSGGILGATVY